MRHLDAPAKPTKNIQEADHACCPGMVPLERPVYRVYGLLVLVAVYVAARRRTSKARARLEANFALFLLHDLGSRMAHHFCHCAPHPNPWVLAAIVTAVVVVGAALVFVGYITVGGDDNHVLCKKSEAGWAG